jgi:hypothetical protein
LDQELESGVQNKKEGVVCIRRSISGQLGKRLWAKHQKSTIKSKSGISNQNKEKSLAEVKQGNK